jgi:uncharacterized protein
MTSAADLFALQEIDLARDARRAIIADIEARLGETEELVEARESAADSQAALDRMRRRQKELDNELEDLDAKMRPLDKKLYDGSVRNPKELTDMKRELDSLKSRRSALDERGLSLIDSVEAATGSLKEAQENLSRQETAWQTNQKHLMKEKTKAESEYQSLEGQRARNTEGMDRRALGLYENLRLSKQGRAVARVERGTCQGCRITLPTHLVQGLRAGTELVQCPSCERILVAG